MNKVKITKIERGSPADVYDVTVQDSHHYILASGVVSHNTQEMYPREVFSGGCLNGDAEVLMASGEFKEIQYVTEGELVQTLAGAREVKKKVSFKDKELYEVKLSTGKLLVCSADHRFLIHTCLAKENGVGASAYEMSKEDSNWAAPNRADTTKLARTKKLVSTTSSHAFEHPKCVGSASSYLEVAGLRKLDAAEQIEVHDICVDDQHHYLVKADLQIDGKEIVLVSHNTGAIYNASTILMLSKAKLKSDDMDDLDLGQSGIVVTAKTQKNRMAKPKKVKFEISFVSGANPYKGLEYWCTEENFKQIGIAKGKMVIDKATGEEYFQAGGNNWYVRHIGKSVPGKHLHTSQVFTKEVLEGMFPVLKAYFAYSSAQEQADANKQHEELLASMDEASVHGKDVDDISADDLFS